MAGKTIIVEKIHYIIQRLLIYKRTILIIKNKQIAIIVSVYITQLNPIIEKYKTKWQIHNIYLLQV